MNSRAYDYGALISRVALGLVLLAHSVYLKLVVYTLPGTAQFFASIGLPASSAYIVFAVEALAGVGLIVGYYVRVAAALAIPILLGATWVHSANGWLFTNGGGGWEYPMFLASIAVAQIFLGPGALNLPTRDAAPSNDLDREQVPHGT